MSDLRLLNVDQACEILSISKPTLYMLSSQGRIRKVKIGGALRFRLSDLEKFIQEHVVEPREELVVA